MDEVIQGEDSRREELKSRGKGSVICVDSWSLKVRLRKRVKENQEQ